MIFGGSAVRPAWRSFLTSGIDSIPLFYGSSRSEGKPDPMGGQAVIEGVMMRSPSAVSVAVRRPDGKIVVKRDPFRSWTKKFPVLGIPLVRGGIVLIESLVVGIRALNFSSDVAMQETDAATGDARPSTASGWLIAGTMVVAFAFGLGLFFYLPLVLTELLGIENGIVFNLVDGAFRLAIFLAYILAISLWREIRRIFEYHGAEHKSIFAYESRQPLTVKSVKTFTTRHPRCGTSFLLVVMLVSLVVFMILGRPQTVLDRLIRFLCIPLIGGVSYEIIKSTSTRAGRAIARTLVVPGLWLQRITTREPDDRQLEVALEALKSVLDRKPGAGVEPWNPQP